MCRLIGCNRCVDIEGVPNVTIYFVVLFLLFFGLFIYDLTLLTSVAPNLELN